MNLREIMKLTKSDKLGAESNDALAFRALGDENRDAKRYPEASEAYGKYLASYPDDFGIWVQRGNCLKDTGDFSAGRMAYENAIRIKPDDADVHLQLGHLLKLQGRREDAIRAYKKALELDEQSGLAAAELKNLGVKMKPLKSLLERPEFASTSVKLLDISDLLFFLRVHNRVTGIQRVQACIALECIKNQNQAGAPIIFTYSDQDTCSFFGLASKDILGLVDLVVHGDATHEEVKALVDRVMASKNEIVPRKGDVYVLLGAFWIGSGYSALLLRLKNKGVKIGVYIYDLIPLSHPQFVVADLCREFFNAFGEVMPLVDFILTISDHVAKEVEVLVRNDLGRVLPVHTIPLAHELPLTEDGVVAPDDDFIGALPEEFVLCVCTIEVRKNHLLLLNAWSALNRKYAGKIPHLVLVGRWGWHVDEFRSRLETQNYVDGKIIILGNLSDGHLQYLYQNCLFTVFPSFVEGWGLPVGESLAYGKPCIASNTSSIPEVGGDLCRYLNPYDTYSATAEIERAFIDREGLRQWTDEVVRNFKIRTWAEVAENFISQIDRSLKESEAIVPTPTVELQSSRFYKINRNVLNATQDWNGRRIRFICVDGWHPFEEWGVWSSRRIAKLEFGTNIPPNTPIRVLLELRLPPPTSKGLIAVRSNDHVNGAKLGSTGKWAAFETVSDERGIVRLQIERQGEVKHIEEDRELYFGLGRIAYHAKEDIGARIELLETLLLFQDESEFLN
jgi:glycosyltransferase involved in cell wall biosynthesis